MKQQLWGLSLPLGAGAPRVGDDVTDAASGEKIGAVTSVTFDGDRRVHALAYLRCRVGGAQVNLRGISVSVAGAKAKVVEPPYSVRAFAAHAVPPQPAAGSSLAERAAAAKAAKGETKSAEEEAKAERLRAMQERMAAWTQQQGGKQ